MLLTRILKNRVNLIMLIYVITNFKYVIFMYR